MTRFYFGEQPATVPEPLALLYRSYDELLQPDTLPAERLPVGLQGAFQDVFPISTTNGTSTVVLDFVRYRLGTPRYTVSEAIIEAVSYTIPIYITFRLSIYDDNDMLLSVMEDEMHFGEFPLLTPDGNFVINGNAKVCISQIIRAPGPYIRRKTLQIIAQRGPWVRIGLDSRGRMMVQGNRTRKKVVVTQLFRAMGLTADEILQGFYETSKMVRTDSGWETKFYPEGVLDHDLICAKTKKVLAEAGTPAANLQKFAGQKVVLDTEDLVGLYLAAPMVLKTGSVEREFPAGTEIKSIHLRRIVHVDKLLVLRPGNDPTLLTTWLRDRGKPVSNEIQQLADQLVDPEQYSLGRLGRQRMNERTGLDLTTTNLTALDLLTLCRCFVQQLKGDEPADLIDHMGNRHLILAGQSVANKFRDGLIRIDRMIRDRMANMDLSVINRPKQIVDPRPVVNTIKEFFNKGDGLVQYMEQTNPLSSLTHRRRISAFGQGGLTRGHAGAEARDVHPSHYGRICPIETPESGSIGLVSSPAAYAQINESGQLVTPYRVVSNAVVTDDKVHYTADREDQFVIAAADNLIDDDGRLLGPLVMARHNGEQCQVAPEHVDLMDIVPGQAISLSTSLIPFLANDDANRALMGSNMQRQAVPLLNPKSPIVGTGLEATIASGSGATVVAMNAGKVVQVDAHRIVVRSKKGSIDRYPLIKFQKSNKGTCVNQRPIVRLGDEVEAGQTLADGSATEQGELALGQNILVAFMPWYGYNFEDAILVSERVVQEDLFTSIHIDELEVMARETTNGLEEITRDIPNVSRHSLRHLDETGVAYIGAHVQAGDIIVGKVTPKGEEASTAEDELFKAIFTDKTMNVRDSSLRMPAGSSGTVIDVQIRQQPDEEDDRYRDILFDKQQLIKADHQSEMQVIERDLREQLLALTEGYTIRSGPSRKSRITAELLDGMTIDRLSRVVIRDEVRMDKVRKLWTRFEEYRRQVVEEFDRRMANLDRKPELQPGVVKSVRVMVAVKRTLSPGDKMSGRHGNKGVISKIAAVADMPFLQDGTPVDIVLNPLGVPSRMNIGQILETHLGWAVAGMGEHIGKVATAAFNGASEGDINQMLAEAARIQGITDKDKLDLKITGQEILIDGCTGEEMERPVTVGYMYMMKLHHLIDEKIHARSIGPYSAITQQPLGGKSHNGGQRLGEMEVWALEAYGAAHTLREMLTIKSDDVVGRQRVYHSIISGKEIPKPMMPEAFKVLIAEMRALGLNIELLKDEGSEEDPDAFDRVQVQVATANDILSWSKGEVADANTINYRTLKPEPNGLFCTKIFGPVKDYECLCGRYKRVKYENVVCQNCGTPVVESKVRRERMGHITLAVPIAHPLFLKTSPYYMAVVLGMSAKKLMKVSSYDLWVVMDPGVTTCVEGELLTYEQLLDIQSEYGDEDVLVARTGGAAILEMLENINLGSVLQDLLEIEDPIPAETRRINLIKGMLESGVTPTNMVLTHLPVLPPDLRPLISLDGGRFATSDVNDLYRLVINRNNRLARLLEIRAPELVIHRESKLVQEAINNLFDNRADRVPQGKRQLKSLSDRLKGKQGRFRQNLLGKRVDYSGRSVIMVGPQLKLHQCGLPKEMAVELFKPFIYGKLREQGYASNNKTARMLVESGHEAVYAILENVIADHPVLLNRAPTLHRLGIQAFQPILHEGRAILLHPLVCTAFNADFDGDQMAVHVPLSDQARLEAKELMLATNNILNPSNGRPIIVPSQDMVLGLYYLSLQAPNPQTTIDCDLGEAVFLWETRTRRLHDPIRLRTPHGLIDTTVGRALLAQQLPDNPDLDPSFYNQVMLKGRIGALINHVYRVCGRLDTVEFIDKIMQLGMQVSTVSGISFGKDDLIIPDEKEELLQTTQAAVDAINAQFKSGLVSSTEQQNRVIEKWMGCSDEIAKQMMEQIETPDDDGYNSVFIMADSGARGSPAQIRQLAGMRGLMSKPNGEIMAAPIRSNFKEGLKALEYFNSTHGSRKGLVDTTMKTSDSGYLTRRLVDVTQDVVITVADCGTTNGLVVEHIVDSGDELIPLEERLIGRTLATDVVVDEQTLAHAEEILTEERAIEIVQAGARQVKVRSILTCEADHGVCAKCYGMDLAHGRPAVVGEAVGVIAAQSIGEPGTQLTLRNFHAGGAAQTAASQKDLVADGEGTVTFDGRVVVNRLGKRIVVDRNAKVVRHDGNAVISHRVPYGATLAFEDGDPVLTGDKLATWDPFARPIISEAEGVVHYRDLVEGVSMQNSVDPTTGLTHTTVLDWQRRDKELQPRLSLRNQANEIVKLASGVAARYTLYPGATLQIRPGSIVSPGDVLARLPVETVRSSDITGGLMRIEALFEMRAVRSQPALFAEHDGLLKIGPLVKNRRTLEIHTDSMVLTYGIDADQTIIAQDGEQVKAGEMLVDGEPELQDILKVFGMNAFATYLIREVQKVYRLQGIEINDKHIEIIAKQMLRKVQITDPGSTDYIVGQLVDLTEWQQVNLTTEEPAEAVRLVQGITEASLRVNSFLSAASFQETTKVLSEAALCGRVDDLVGPKENIITGRVIPLGTGVNPDFAVNHHA